LSASRKNPMICSSVNRFFMSNLLCGCDWTLISGATQDGGTSVFFVYGALDYALISMPAL
ncbi:MAG: hypothetical protein AB1400_11665, partial [Pseudomonadota bacterium]